MEQATSHAPADYRVRIIHDDDAQFEELNGKARPMTAEEYIGNEYMRDGKEVPYDEYLRYQGNPDRHVYGAVIVDTLCGCCGEWKKGAASLWNIDFMDDNPEAAYINNGKVYTATEAIALPGYLGECASEVLDEAGYEAPK